MKKKKPNFKPLAEEERAKYLEDFMKPFDFEAAVKRGVFINLDNEVIQYFKDLAGPDGKGYQALIQQALRHYKDKKLKPKNVWGK